MRKAAFCAILLVLGIFLAGVRPAAAVPRYTCLDLTKAPGMALSSTYPRGIDNAGEVVGYGYLRSSAQPFLNHSGVSLAPLSGLPTSGTSIPTPFFYSGGRNSVPDIGSPPVPNAGWETESLGRGKWWLAGRWYDASNTPHAWVGSRESGTANWEMTPLRGWASGVNDSGQAAGASFNASGFAEAFLYSGGVMQPLGRLPVGGSSEARGINNAGQVVGQSGHAFLYDGTMHDLGTLPAPYDANSDAYAINEAGQVVGDSSGTSGGYPVYHAFLYTNGEMQDLGALPGGLDSRAYGVNDLGQVVGYSSSASDTRAFLYSDGVMHDLTSLVQNLPAGVVLSAAYGINDRGQIIAMSTYINHSYLLTPITPVSVLPLLLQ